MSQSKNKYFVVSQTTLVKAINKGEAERAARKRNSSQVLWSDSAVAGIRAVDAHLMVESAAG